MKVLVTGAGAPGTKGTVYCIRQGNRRADVLGIDIRRECSGKYLLDGFWQAPQPESSEYLPFLKRLCDRENVDVIVPQTTREAAALADKEKDLGVPITVSSRKAVDLANDKWLLAQKFPEDAAKCFLVNSPEELETRAEQLGYPGAPVVVKPRVSDGMRGLRILSELNSQDTRTFLEEKPEAAKLPLREFADSLHPFPELMVMEYLPGKEYSVDMFHGQQFIWSVPRVRDRVVNGISFETSTDRETRSKLISITCGLALNLDLWYAFGFQFKEDAEGVPKLLECNPRVQGTMVTAAMAGANVIWWAVKEALHQNVREEPKMHDLRLFRYWGAVGVDEEGKVSVV